MTVSDSGVGVLWVTLPEVAVIVIAYVPGGVPGLPFPPPPPCSPPPHDMRMTRNSKVTAPLRARAPLLSVRANHSMPAIGNVNVNIEKAKFVVRGIAAVV